MVERGGGLEIHARTGHDHGDMTTAINQISELGLVETMRRKFLASNSRKSP
jgi:hypothetical protein